MAIQDPLAGTNLGYVEELYARYLMNPASVDADWRSYFETLRGGSNGSAAEEVRRAVDGPGFRPSSIFNPPSEDRGATPTVLPIRERELPPLPEVETDERVRFLRGVSLFHEVPQDALVLIARLAEEEHVANGEHLFHEGDPGDSLYLLIEGSLLIRRRDGVVVTLRPGDPVGELGVFSTQPRVADAVALGDVRVLNLGREHMMALIERRPSLARSFLRVLSSRLREDQSRQDKINQLIHNYRVRGHLLAHLDPLGPPQATATPELDPEHYGLGEADLDRLFSSTMIPGTTVMSLRQILERLRSTYCRSIGVQFMHIDDLLAKQWLQARLEDPQYHRRLNRDEQIRILTKLTDAELFEQFIHRKFLGAKRFSLEGAETLIPLVDLTLEAAGRQKVREVVIGMAHRGRLNVLVNVMGKSAREVFREFADADAEEYIGRGDVKYHLGYSTDRLFAGQEMHLSLCFNPSHLEFVNPVLAGRVRAKQERFGDREHRRCLGILIHGDAAFAGQGVVQELFNLSDLEGYRTGGTVHIIVNNQIGFTTPPASARSTKYATDVARMLQTPIFHVNGEDPEAVAHVVRVAMDYRQEFQKDVIIDMYCYRRYGHNEGDEPSYTQPLMYEKIRRRKSVRAGYLDHLSKLGDVDAEEIARKRRSDLEEELSKARDPGYKLRGPRSGEGLWTPYRGGADADTPEVATAVAKDKLAELLRATTRVGEGFEVHKKLKNFLAGRLAMAAGEKPLDWAAAEALGLASLLVEGYPIRLSGQDSGRGTFSHRHAVLHDVKTGQTCVPLAQLTPDQAPLQIWDSPLSEIAVLGFEYGYSLDTPDGLTLWEAQFGDFSNVAQVIIDQFITSSEDKWRRLTGLVMLLPHGFEGQGPEHSSARLERYLDLTAEDNIQVVNLTTPAQFFHCLRRQALRPWRKPLVVMSPKSLLRHPEVTSSLDELAEGGFRRILPDVLSRDPAAVRKIILTSGKVYYELAAACREREVTDIAVLRLEQFYPLSQSTLIEALEPYPEGTKLVWVQEEPRNMGALGFIRLHAEPLLEGRWPLECVTRPVSASPATGSAAAHKKEQAMLIEKALA